ncbi:MAG: YbdK family carboxylate-amine ligase [Thermoleophilaceae bacterium]
MVGSDLDMSRAREVFDASVDFTVGLEEEFGILDPNTLALAHRFEELNEAAQEDEVLAAAVAGELISSEIEIRSGRGESFADAVVRQRDARTRLIQLSAEQDALLSATGTHPFSPWQDQRIIDTEHYRRLQDGLRYVARRNNTFSLHVHVGVRGADRAIAVCDRLRPVLPELLAVSANSIFLDGEDSGLQSVRSQIFSKSFPRCGIPDAFGSFSAYADYVNLLVRTESIVEHTQLWWSVRPHHAFGTVEVRICDAQSSAHDSTALAGLITSCVAQAALDHDEGVGFTDPPARSIEENFWRAIRYGLDGRLIDLERGEEFPASAVPDRLLAWTAPARAVLGIDPAVPSENGAQRQRRALAGGASIEEVFAAEVSETQASYAGAAEIGSTGRADAPTGITTAT